MTSEDELSASFEHSCFFFFLSFFFGIRDNKADTSFDKVTVSNDCSGKEAPDPFIFLFFFCIATTNMPLIITAEANLHMHSTGSLKYAVAFDVRG